MPKHRVIGLLVLLFSAWMLVVAFTQQHALESASIDYLVAIKNLDGSYREAESLGQSGYVKQDIQNRRDMKDVEHSLQVSRWKALLRKSVWFFGVCLGIGLLSSGTGAVPWKRVLIPWAVATGTGVFTLIN